MSAHERLAAWADGDIREVVLRAQPDMYANGLTFWELRVMDRSRALHVEVDVGPSGDPEAACALGIERLAAAGVVVP